MAGEGLTFPRFFNRNHYLIMEVKLDQICKNFGKLQANQDITLTIPGGTIQGILGENGAGKSTLMKILSGYIQADRGEIYLDGKPVTHPFPGRCHPPWGWHVASGSAGFSPHALDR